MNRATSKTLLPWILIALCTGTASAQVPAQAPIPIPIPIPIPPGPCVQTPPKVDERNPAEVVLVRGGWVVIEALRPLRTGERFHIYSQRRVRGLDPRTREDGWVPEAERTGMLVIERVNGNQGAGRLVRNAYAELGDLAVPTTDYYSETLIYGRRFPGVWRLHADVATMPLIGSNTGFGLLAQAALEYRFAVPLKLAVEFGPSVLATGLLGSGSSGGTFISNIHLDPTLTGSLRGVLGLAFSGFELDVGLGGAVDSGRASPWAMQMKLGVRLGSLDGFNLTASSAFFLPVGGRPTEFDSAIGTINIPVHRRLTMILSSGGGSSPFWVYGTFGFRIYAHGTGGPGTTIASLAIGGGGMEQRNQCPPPSTTTLSCTDARASEGGPLFQLGFDHRF